MNRPNFRYRPEIDGLRALAVIPVVFYHANLGFPGGFVGVDVFFVISGYLITSLLLRDLDRGTFSMLDFWERRIRRIVPALSVMILGAMILGWFFLLPADFADLGKSMIAQAVMMANVYFLKSGGYFAGPAEEKPLLHTWSLAVEEQFYLFFPLMLILFYHLVKRHRPSLLLALLSLGFLSSLALAVFCLSRWQSATFYLLPTRAWELLAGSLVAALPARVFPARRGIRECLATISLAAIVVPVFLYTKETPFPGLTALPPVLGAALFIFASQRNEDTVPHTLAARILQWKPAVWIGLISYSLYLWHWPLMAISNYWFLRPDDGIGHSLWPIALVAVSILVATLSYYCIETPFRKKSWFHKSVQVYGFGSVAIFSAFVAGFATWKQDGFHSRFRDPVQHALIRSADLRGGVYSCNENQISADQLYVIGNKEEPIDFVIWGDSHARHLTAAFEEFSMQFGLNGRVIYYGATPPLLGFVGLGRGRGLGISAPTHNQKALEYIASKKPKAVVIAAYWEIYQDDPNFFKCLEDTASALASLNIQSILMLDIPSFEKSVPKVFLREKILGISSSHDNEIDLDRYLGATEKLRESDSIKNFTFVIDPKKEFFNRSGKMKSLLLENGESIYQDAHHLTTNGSKNKILPLLQDNKHIFMRDIGKID